MKNPFDYTSANWVKYSQYEWKKVADGTLYLTPTEKAEPWSYDPLQNAETLVLDALDIALLCFHKKPDTEIQSAILRFARKYGLLGIMTALPTTARFVEYEKVYFLKNQFITEEAMDTTDYVSLFFPFTKLDFSKRGVESVWNISDRKMIALAMTYQTSPQAQAMSFMRNYAERYDWITTVFKDWAFTFFTSFFYYHDYDKLDEYRRDIYRQAITAFDGNAPSYHIELRDRPTLVWDFHSLMLGIQMMFSFMLTDDARPLRLCHECQKPFVAKKPNDNVCCNDCREKYNAKHNQP